MNVCDFCQSEDVTHSDRDDIEYFCDDCYKELDKEYIEFNGIRKI